MASQQPALILTPARFLSGLALLLLLMFWKASPNHSGDIAEYSPSIRR